MNVTREISPDRDVTLTIEIEASVTDAKFKETFNQFRTNARIPGFRPGKVPADFIRKRYGREIWAEIIDEVSKDHLKKALDEEKLEIAGPIKMEVLEFGEGKPLRYQVRFPLPVEVTLGDYKGLHILLNDAEVTDSDVDAQIEGLRRKHAHLRSIETPAPVGALVSVKVHEVHPSGLTLVGRPVEEMQIEFGADTLGAGSDEQLIGIKAGETRVIRVRESGTGLTGAPQGHTILTPGEAAGREQAEGVRSYSVEAVTVEESEIHELNDEFASHINPNLKSVDDLRQYIKLMLLSYASHAMHSQMEAALTGRLIEDNPFPVPRGIIEGTLEQVAGEMKLPDENLRQFIEEHYREAVRDYRWVLIRDEIARRENITVTDEELNLELQHLAERTGETMEAVSRRFADEDKLEKLRGRIFEGRVLDLLAQNAEIEKRLVPLMELLRVGG